MTFKRLAILTIVLTVIMTAGSHAQDTVTSFRGAFQPFERGFMLWRGDTGDIWVLNNNGTTRYFSESDYSALPDNPVEALPPDDKSKPIRGFGRVWGNNPDIQETLGWALRSEVGYLVRWENVSLIGNGAIGFLVNFPDGQHVLLRDNNTWHFHNTSTPAAPQRIITVAYQPFEGGIMLYMGDTGRIWILNNSGDAQSYESHDYGGLPHDPYQVVPPAGLFKPILGFGQVWGYFSAVRYRLGWASIPELTYQTPFELVIEQPANASVVSFIIALPDGHQVQIYHEGRWLLLD